MPAPSGTPPTSANPHIDDAIFRTLVEQVRDHAIFMLDANGYNVTWNEGVKRVLGYEEDEWLGQSLEGLYPTEDIEAGVPAVELRTAKSEGAASDDRWLVRKGGERFFASGITTRLLDDHGNVLGFAKVIRDLTADRTREEVLTNERARLEVALRAARMGTWRLDLESLALEIDDALLELVHLPRGAAPRTLGELLARIEAHDRDEVRAALERARAGEGPLTVQLRVRPPDGRERFLSCHAQVVRPRDARPYAAGVCADVTERRKNEARLAEAQRLDAVGQLAGGVAHEINNMLTVILGYSSLLLGQLDEADPNRRDIESIDQAAARAARVTEQLLAFSRRQLLRPQVLSVNSVVHALEPMLRHILGEDRSLELDVEQTPSCIHADPTQIELVLVNLVLNARDAVPSGGHVRIATAVTKPSPDLPLADACRDATGDPASAPTGRSVVLRVHDDGVGMDRATRAHAFDPFFTTKPVGQGTGLGLSMVLGTVKQSHGAVHLESEFGKGTTIELEFPEVAGTVANEPPLERGAAAPRGLGALVVEDEPLVREVTCRHLRAEGYRCIEASNGAEALEAVRREGGAIDVVVADLVMPEMSGQELKQHLEVVAPDLPILLVTGYGELDPGRQGRGDIDAPVLRKPFSHDELTTMVGVLARRGHRRGAGQPRAAPP